MEPYSNYFTGMDPEVISMQVNYLRMLANYYKQTDTPKNEVEPEENILERSLRAESVFLQDDIIDVEAMPNDSHNKEVLSFSPPRNKSADHEKNAKDEPFSDFNSFRRKDSLNKDFKQLDDSEEDFVVKKPIRRQVSYGNDEQPIKAGGSFEQLLERELKKNNSFEPFIEESQVSLPPRIKSQRIVPKVRNDELPLKKLEKKTSSNNSETTKPRKSLIFHSNLNQSEELLTPKTKPSEESPKPKPKFLKRGQGKLCVDRKSVSKPSSVNTSKILFTEKSETHNEVHFSDKDEDLDKALYLDEQIKHYHSENSKLQKLIKEVEDKKKRLDREKADFLKEKEKKLEELEKWKNEENEKIKKEKLKYEKKLRVQMKEKDEIAELKKYIQVLEKEKAELKQNYDNLLKKNTPLGKNPQSVRFSPSNSESETENPVVESDSVSNLSSNEHHSKLDDSIISSSSESKKSVKSNDSPDPDSEFLHRPPGGKKEIQYSNGIKKEVYPDGYSIVYFNNKDIKQSFPDGRTVYHYSEAKTVQTTFPDGLQLFKFANGQIEKHFPDGSKEISFQDGTVKCVYPDGQEESVFPDGTVQTVDCKGVKFIEFVNGQRDTIYPNGVKIRKYPDGRVKKIMPDGKVLEQ